MTLGVHFFKVAFATSGTKVAVPEASQPDGSVSYTDGWGPDYALEQGVDPGALDIPRDQSNQLYYDITTALHDQQTHGVPGFISTADNGGTPYSYDKAALVRYDDGSGLDVYISLATANIADPTDATKWARLYQSSIPAAVEWGIYSSTLPSGGWLWCDGRTIGSAASGATSYANAAAQTLFTVLWNSIPNVQLPIQTSAGAASTRGVSAAADFAANKRLPLPDRRGRVAFGNDAMGGTAANRLTGNTAQGIVGNILGNTGGEQSHEPTIQETAAHTHAPGTIATASAGDHTHPANMKTPPLGGSADFAQGVNSGNTTVSTVFLGTAGAHTHTITGSTASAGSGDDFNEIPPGIVYNVIIKL